MADTPPEPSVRIVYGWECDTCGAREVPLDPWYDQHDAERDSEKHDCDTYWEITNG